MSKQGAWAGGEVGVQRGWAGSVCSPPGAARRVAGAAPLLPGTCARSGDASCAGGDRSVGFALAR